MDQGQSGKSDPADQREVLDAAMEAGHILLENGAEIFRVEETIDRICHHFGVESEDAFVLSNGIFLTAGNEREKQFARVRHIPVKGAQLDKVAAVNQLSREIEAGLHTLTQVREELARIRKMPGETRVAEDIVFRNRKRMFLCPVRREAGGLSGRFPDRTRAVSLSSGLRKQVFQDRGKHRRRGGDHGIEPALFATSAGHGYEPYDQRGDHAPGAGTGLYQRNPGHR